MDLSEIEKFRDPIWRTSHLYSIRERGGKVIRFRPRPQQSQVLDMIYRRGLKRIVILKARQPWRKLRWLACSIAQVLLPTCERMPHVTVLTGFRGDARDSPPDLLDQFFSNRRPKPRVLR